jgi:hypothetical protein
MNQLWFERIRINKLQIDMNTYHVIELQTHRKDPAEY